MYHNNLDNSFIEQEKTQIENITNKENYVFGNNLSHFYNNKDVIKNIYFKAELG